MQRLFAFNLLVLSASLVATALGAGDEKKTDSPVTAVAAFDRLKTLVGDWKNSSSACDPGAEEAPGSDVVTYKLTGAGTALVEVSMPGTPMEMTSIYHLDGDDLRMTHYCALGNQPRLKLDKAASKADRLVFAFDGGTNLDPAKDTYISGLVVNFHPDGRVVADWQGCQAGETAGPTTFELTRAPK